MSLTVANKITILRILAVPFFVATILDYSPERDYLRQVALAIFVFAVISDVIDGIIARVKNQRTPAGAILDPLADKLLLMSAFLTLYQVGNAFPVSRFPIWLVVAVISRDVLLLLGAVLTYVLKGRLTVEATKWGKACTFFESIAVIVMLCQWPITLFWYITMVFIGISGIDYLWNGMKQISNNQDEVR